jgi:HAE1 family hydrophobic/amphiphilic exporter-1
VVGGLAFSQIVTLYVTPVFYTYLDELQGWMARKFSARAGAAEDDDAADTPPHGAPVPSPVMGD